MKQLRTAIAALTLMVTPAVLIAQRGPEPQQGTGQNNPDMETGSSPAGKSAQPNTSGAPKQQGTGQNSPDTQQQSHGKHTGNKQKHKEHGGSHDQASPQT